METLLFLKNYVIRNLLYDDFFSFKSIHLLDIFLSWL